MADSSNQPKLDQQQSHQPLLAPQLIAVNSTATIPQSTSLPVARPAAPVIVRPHINHASPARSLFVIRPSTATTVASPASRIIVQQTSPHPIVAQTVTPAILTPSPLDTDNQPDASNAPVATLLRNAPISMRFDGQPHPVTAKPLTDRLSVFHRFPCGPGNYAATATKLKVSPATQGPTPSSPQRKVIREMQVRVCTRPDRKFSVLRYNAYDRIDLSGASSGTPSGDNKSSGSTLQEVFLQRENNLRQYKATHSIVDAPTRGAGSEFGQEAKEEARLRRLGIVRQGYRVEDQPWLLTVGKGRTAKRYKGVREGNVSANVRHFIFCQTKDGNFDAYPVHEWYKFNPEVNYRFLRDEEAEAEYSRRHKTMNLFNVMVKRKMGDESTEEGAVDINEPNIRTRTGMGSISKSDKSVKQNRSSALLLTELDEWKGLGLDDDDDEEEEDGNEGGAGDEETAKTGEVDDSFMKRSDDAKKKKTDSKKKRAAAIVARKRRATKQRARRRRKGALGNSSGEEDDVNEEAWDESDPDDHEGDEVQSDFSFYYCIVCHICWGWWRH
uniref:Transcription initiation factor IIF subunit alpha n=1 Tax=Mesocestoides corti TaxID=53468 RepID=A0A5K3ES69_MESCO